MKNFFTIARREFAQLAHTPAIYCVLAAITVFYSFIFYNDVALTRQSNLQPAGIIFGWLSVFVVPVLTMRSFAGEEASGTIELLLTAPVRAWEVVVGKFVGCWGFYTLSMLPLVGYAIIFSVYGEVDSGELLGIACGLLLTGAAQVATGLLASGLTGNVIVAAAGGCVANFFVMMLSLPLDQGAGVYSFPAALSWWSHFREVFAKGVFDSRSMLYFLTFIILLLFLTWLRLVSRGLFAMGGQKRSTRSFFLSALCVLAGINVFVFAGLAHQGWRTMLTAIGEGAFWGAGWPALVGFVLVVSGLLVLGLKRRGKASGCGGGAGFFRHWPAWVAVLAALLIFANINYLNNIRRADFRLYYRLDMTANLTNTLTPALRESVDQLEGPLKVTVFLSEGAEYDGLPLARRVRDLLSDLCSYSPQISVRYYDAAADATQARAVAVRLELPLAELDKLTVLEYQGKMMVLPASAFLRAPGAQELMAGAKKAFFQGELAMSVGIRRIADQRVTRISFATGHGEMPIGKAGRDPKLAGVFAETLGREAYEVRPWMLTGEEEVPAGTDVLVLAGPTVPFSPAATQCLRSFAERGGRLFILLPSTMQAQNVPGLDELLEFFGVKMRNDVVVDEKNNDGGQPTQILALMEEGAGISTGLRQTVLVLPDSRSLAISEAASKANNWQMSRLVRSVKGSQRYNPTAKKFSAGPATIAVMAARPAQGKFPEARVVVMGCAAMASNLYIGSESNQTFLLNTCRWLAGREYGIRPQERNYLDYRLNINADGLRLVWWLAVVGLPQIWLLAAAGVWLMRRD